MSVRTLLIPNSRWFRKSDKLDGFMNESKTDNSAARKRRQRDFFVSFNKADLASAQLIRDWLKEGGFSTFMQHPDFHAGSNIVLKMDEGVKTCRRLLAVLSQDYIDADFPQPEWAAFFAKDPRGKLGLVVGVRVSKCDVEGLLGTIRYIDLVNFSADERREKLLSEIDALPAVKKSSARRTPPRVAAPMPPVSSAQNPVTINVRGNAGNVAGRDLTVHHYTKPSKPKVILERRDTWISDSQAAEIKERMKEFAQFRFETSNGKLNIAKAFSFSWSDFNKAHDIPRYDALPAERFDDALAWFRQQKGILTRKLRKLDRPAWRNARIGSIKKAMKEMGRENVDYYLEIAARLKMKPFESLTGVTDRNLQRIYQIATRDAGENKE